MNETNARLFRAVGLENLMEALARADRKGYLPDAIREAYAEVDWWPVDSSESQQEN